MPVSIASAADPASVVAIVVVLNQAVMHMRPNVIGSAVSQAVRLMMRSDAVTKPVVVISRIAIHCVMMVRQERGVPRMGAADVE